MAKCPTPESDAGAARNFECFWSRERKESKESFEVGDLRRYCYALTAQPGKEPLIVDAFGVGNQLMLINDCRFQVG